MDNIKKKADAIVIANDCRVDNLREWLDDHKNDVNMTDELFNELLQRMWALQGNFG